MTHIRVTSSMTAMNAWSQMPGLSRQWYVCCYSMLLSPNPAPPAHSFHITIFHITIIITIVILILENHNDQTFPTGLDEPFSSYALL